MPRENHRQRKPVSARRARRLTVIGFRYSISRDAYVLRLVGNRIGPVYQIQATARPGSSADQPNDASKPVVTHEWSERPDLAG